MSGLRISKISSNQSNVPKSLKKDNQALKKQLDETQRDLKNLYNFCPSNR